MVCGLVYLSVLSLCLFSVGVVWAQEPDVEGGKDHPLFNRMPGFYMSQYEEKDFETHNFLVNNKEQAVEGRYYYIMYTITSGVREPSRIQVLSNFENAIKKIGGTVLFRDDDGNSYLKVVKGGKEFWVHVNSYITSQYTLYIIEKGGMAQDITANADVFDKDILATGHTAVYGIYFDTNKAEIKPTSTVALSEIVKLLKGKPNLKIFVVGHTDSTGDVAVNMKLSQARAEAVLNALVGQYGIAATRLKGYGVGPLAPVASNDTEEGKAKNRRVELVKQ